MWRNVVTLQSFTHVQSNPYTWFFDSILDIQYSARKKVSLKWIMHLPPVNLDKDAGENVHRSSLSIVCLMWLSKYDDLCNYLESFQYVIAQ